jgi:hypothetical protein
VLLELHDALRRLLYERGQISPREVAIQFEAPTRERVERLLLPTLNFFLFEVRENTELRQNAYQTRQVNGRAERRAPPRRFDLRYMVSALSSVSEDEHLLLWRSLTTLGRYSQIPEELLPVEVSALKIPLVTRLCEGEESQRLLNIWSALGTQPRAALAYVVTVPVDLATIIEAPLVLTRITRYTSKSFAEQVLETGRLVGGVVRASNGEPLAGIRVSLAGRAGESVTNSEGRFVLSNVPAGQVNLSLISSGGQTRRVTIADTEDRPVQAADFEIIL